MSSTLEHVPVFSHMDICTQSLPSYSYLSSIISCFYRWVTQTVKNLSAIQKTQVQSLGWEDPLEKELATHSSIVAWGMPWTEEPGGLQSKGPQRVGQD